MTRQDGFDAAVEADLEVPMRDGVVLRADVWRPAGTHGDRPVLLCRTPYDKTHPRYRQVAEQLVAAGFIVVVQDIRGRHASDGEWIWHLDARSRRIEREDGYDTCEWSARLTGSDGQVGVWGNSYPAYCSWLLAAGQPPSLRALFSSGFPTRMLDTTFGTYESGIRTPWLVNMSVSTRHRLGDRSYPATREQAAEWWQRERGKWLWHVPLTECAHRYFGPNDVLQYDYLEHLAREAWHLDDVHQQVLVPTCTLTGWWDRLNGAVKHFSGMLANGPAATRSEHRLIIGPWIHDIEGAETWVPPQGGAVDDRDLPTRQMIRWFDWQLRGRRNALSDGPPLRAFILNERRWRFWPEWPPADTHELVLYLNSAGDANREQTPGSLATSRPRESPPDHYRYDPMDPVMSLHEGQLEPQDQAPLNARADVLRFQTEPLTAPVVVTGNPVCRLWVSSDCPDTDFVARLIEVPVDGPAINVAQTLLRMRYRNGYDQEVPIESDHPIEIVLELPIVGIEFGPGSRIRLDVTSSDFPAFDRNHNTGLDVSSDISFRIAHQRLFHDQLRPSSLTLPCAERPLTQIGE